MGFKKAVRGVLESLNRGLGDHAERLGYLEENAASSEALRAANKRIDDLLGLDKEAVADHVDVTPYLEERIDAQARTIAELEKQIAGLRGAVQAQKDALRAHLHP